MGNLWIYEGELCQQEDYTSPEETEDGIAMVNLRGYGWVRRSGLIEVDYDMVCDWFHFVSVYK